MFSKFPSFPFSITKCDIGGGGGMETCQAKGCSQGWGGGGGGGGGGGQHRGEGGGWGAQGDGP